MFSNNKRIQVQPPGPNEEDWSVPVQKNQERLAEIAKDESITLSASKKDTPEGQWWLTKGRELWKRWQKENDDDEKDDPPPTITQTKKKGKKESKKEANKLKSTQQWQGDLSEEAIDAIRALKLPGEYKEPPKPPVEIKSSGDRSSIESTKNPALIALLRGDYKNEEPLPTTNTKKWQWDKKIIERGLTAYTQVYKPWVEAKSSQALLALLQKDDGVIIGRELRRYYNDFGTVKRATSPSLIAALQQVTNQKTTANINSLLDALVRQAGNRTQRQNFIKQLGKKKPDFIEHLKQYSLSSEFQTRNSLKLGVVKELFIIDKKNKSQTPEEKTIVESVAELSKARHAARTRILEIQSSFNQKNPISFMASDLFQFVRNTVDSDNIDDKIMLVQLCTGARWIEVVKVSDFFLTSQTTWKEAADNPISAYHGHDPQRDIVVKGIAKVRRQKKAGVQPDQSESEEKDEPDNDEVEGNEAGTSLEVDSNRVLPPKPVLFVKPEMIQHTVYNLIRPYFNKRLENSGGLANTNNKDIASAFNADTNKRLREHHSLTANEEDSGRVKTHTLRKLYANYSYDVYAAKSITKPAWIQMVLGHLPTSFTTSLAYNTANVFDAVPQNKEPAEQFTTSEIKSYLKQIQDTDTTVVKAREGVLTLPIVPRKGPTHAERKRKFQELYTTVTSKNVEPTYVLFQNLGFSNKYIQKQFKQLKKNKK